MTPVSETMMSYLISSSGLQLLKDINRKEGNVLFNDTLNTFYLRFYMASDIW